MTNAPAENRSLARIPCAIPIIRVGEREPFGLIRNISLDGVFVETSSTALGDDDVRVRFELGAGTLRPTVQVVHRLQNGLGLRFAAMERKETRQLRRYITEVNTVLGQQNRSSRLHAASTSITKPLTNALRIAGRLAETAKGASCQIIPESRPSKCNATLTELTDDALDFTVAGTHDLAEGEHVYVLYTHEFASYSFQADVLTVSNPTLRLSFPDQLHYSEKRSRDRGGTAEDGLVSIPLPWRGNEAATWQVCETTEHGLSFRARPEDALFWPGTHLPRVTLRVDGEDKTLHNAVVKHATVVSDDDGNQWVKVGLLHGIERQDAYVSDASVTKNVRRSGLTQRAQALTEALKARVEYLYHRHGKRRTKASEPPFEVVRFNNSRSNPIVGLLNLTFPSAERTRCPLVIITPGFGGRKETLSAMALTLTHNFRRQGRDIAVLRFDGTNNLGESYKDPGCTAEGKHALNHTVSGAAADILGALAWAKNNRRVQPTEIILISVSFSSISARHVLTMPEGSMVRHWISFMGAPDAQNAIMNVAGNVDAHGNYLRGIKNGLVTLIGCLVEGDQFCEDMHKTKTATLEDARREMALIKSDITWIAGKHDAFMDRRRVHDVMSVKAPGKREVIEVDAGHVPRTSDEALEEFRLITKKVWSAAYNGELDAVIPPRGWLAAVAEAEWKRVRHQPMADQRTYWRDYLLGKDGLGFDIMAYTPQYRSLISDQVRLAAPQGKRVLDLGAGTGNVSRAIAAVRPQSLVCMDLVPEALDRLKTKLAQGSATLSVTTVVGSADGGPAPAMRRWLAGEMASFRDLVGRLPDLNDAVANKVVDARSDGLHAYLRGATLDLPTLMRECRLPTSQETVLRDIHLFARLTLDRMDAKSALAQMSASFRAAVEEPGGLPFGAGSFDVVVCSLVLSYLSHPAEALAEMRRVLAPGGTLILSSMRPDADSSESFTETIAYLQAAPATDLPPGFDRDTLIAAARQFSGSAANLMRYEEEGIFHFWDAAELERILQSAGFEDCQSTLSFGNPPQAVIIRCKRP